MTTATPQAPPRTGFISHGCPKALVDSRRIPTQLRTEGYAVSPNSDWVRMHCVYPYPHVDELIPPMAEGRVLPYPGIPRQHARPTVLKAMNGPSGAETRCNAYGNGGTPARMSRFEAPLSWVFRARPNRTSRRCYSLSMTPSSTGSARFACSPVEGARANASPNAVPEAVKAERLDRFMARAAAVSERRLVARAGRELTVLVDAMDEDRAVAHSDVDAPDIDGCVAIYPHETRSVGEFAKVTLTAADRYHVWAEVRAPD
ncbi:MAG: hypothetical protein AAGA11_02795 [Pseudomonadota bacterium]